MSEHTEGVGGGPHTSRVYKSAWDMSRAVPAAPDSGDDPGLPPSMLRNPGFDTEDEPEFAERARRYWDIAQERTAELAALRAENERLRDQRNKARSLLADMDNRLVQRQAQRDAARAALAEVLGRFTDKGHPGRPCLRTPWITVEQVEQWRAALSGGDTPGEAWKSRTLAADQAADDEAGR